MMGMLKGKSWGVPLMAAMAAMVMNLEEAAAQAPDREYTISIGETLTFGAQGVSRISVGIPEIANVKLTGDNRQILVTGMQVGVTTVNFYTSSSQRTFLIRVVPINPATLAQEAREVLGERSGVDVRVVKGRVLLEGEVSSEAYKKRIDKLAELYPNQMLNFTTYRESFVEGAKMVALTVDFIQLAMTNRDQLGMNWGQFFGMNATFGYGDVPLYYSQGGGAGGGGGGGGGGAGLTPQIGPGIQPGESNPQRLPTAVLFTGGGDLTGYFSLVGNLNLALDFLVENGLIKTRQNGVIVTEAGTEGEFHSGGTLLIQIAGVQATDLREIPYGLRVKVKPIVDVDNRVKLEILAIYSELDAANGVGALPALRNSEFKGTVNMQEGQSVLIAGLNSRQQTSNESGWWLLSSIPILGWAFKSRNFVELGLDNALFVTPRIYEPGGKSHQTLVDGVFERMAVGGMEVDEMPELSNAPSTTRALPKPSAPPAETPAEGFEE